MEYQKFQITNHKYQINHNNQIRNSKPVLVIEYWNLRFVWYLVLGIWDFITSPYSTTPKPLEMFTGKAVELIPGPSKAPLCGEGPGLVCLNKGHHSLLREKLSPLTVSR